MRTILAAVLALVPVACGSHASAPCEKLKNAEEEIVTRTQPCIDASDAPLELIGEGTVDLNQCDASLVKWTSSEQAAINDYADCLNAIPACDPKHPDTFAHANDACNKGPLCI